jgi:hypothetical protein
MRRGDLYALAKILGHSNPKMTLDRYAHLSPEFVHAQRGIMDQMYTGGRADRHQMDAERNKRMTRDSQISQIGTRRSVLLIKGQDLKYFSPPLGRGNEAAMWVPSEFTKAVCFLCVEHKGRKLYGGTAFLVSKGEPDFPDIGLCYLVTAKHCVISACDRYGNLFCRINTTNGRTRFLSLPCYGSSNWFLSDDADVAVLPFDIDATIDMGTFPANVFLTDALIEKENIGQGDELFMIGLFEAIHGRRRNVPVVRSGMIASMFPGEPLQDRDSGQDYRAFLIEARSIGGLSGSPVLMALRTRAEYHPTPRGFNPWTHSLVLMGLIRGHFDLPNNEAMRPDFGTGTMERLNAGIAIVTPIQEVERLLMDDGVRKARRAVLREHKKQ